MPMSRRRAARRGALKNIADGLAQDANSFTPEIESVPAGLPGRQPGAALSGDRRPAPRSAALILDIGTSRREGFTHVLWMSSHAETMLGPESFEALNQRIIGLDHVTAMEWEAADHLHLCAPGRDHDDLLRDVLGVADELLA